MKRICLPLLLVFSLLLSGCGGKEIEKAYASFSERLGAQDTLSFTANVRAEYEHKTARFTLAYTEDAEGASVTVLAPELIAGVIARVEPGGTSLQYDGVVLDTGALDSFGLSPMSALPVLVQAMRSGHVDSFREEDGMYVYCLEPGDEYRCTVWFRPDGMIPVRSELESAGRVAVTAEISGWTEGAADMQSSEEPD